MENFENKNAYVTKKLLEENKKVGFAYREEPDNETDSGWRFFTGEENQEYVDNPNNITNISIDEMIEKDESIKTVLNSEYKTAYEKNNSEFIKLNNYNFGSDLDN